MTGRPAETYWDYRIGHVLHLRPDELGGVTPSDLVGAVNVFDNLFPQDD